MFIFIYLLCICITVCIYGYIVISAVIALEFLSHIKKIFLFWTFPKNLTQSGTFLRGQLVTNLGCMSNNHYLSHHWQQQPKGICNSLTRNNLIAWTVVTCRSVSTTPWDKVHMDCTCELLDSSALPTWGWEAFIWSQVPAGLAAQPSPRALYWSPGPSSGRSFQHWPAAAPGEDQELST